MGNAVPPPRLQSRHISEEPIAPLLSVGVQQAARVELGGRLFRDPRLSADGSRSCSTCHDLATNGASVRALDTGMDGKLLPLNTPTVFNAALNFRFNWEGQFRTLEEQAAASLRNPQIMGSSPEVAVARLMTDSAMVGRFKAVYNHQPDVENLLDAVASFERSLITPNSRFDRWLAGETTALTPSEVRGYQLFKSVGCASCHQGVNIGGNLFSRHGLFKPLASPKPLLLRVPSLRNIAITPPYFHDGSAPTLEDAIRRMAASQLNAGINAAEIASIATFLRTLTGERSGLTGGLQP
nr:cytochrome c peroxidase [uncultured Dongia sp.]